MNLYQVTLTLNELAVLTGTSFLGIKLMQGTVDRGFGDMGGFVRTAMEQHPEALPSLVHKIKLINTQAAADMRREQEGT